MTQFGELGSLQPPESLPSPRHGMQCGLSGCNLVQGDAYGIVGSLAKFQFSCGSYSITTCLSLKRCVGLASNSLPNVSSAPPESLRIMSCPIARLQQRCGISSPGSFGYLFSPPMVSFAVCNNGGFINLKVPLGVNYVGYWHQS